MLAKHFLDHLIKKRLHLGRKDYPSGSTSKDYKKREATFRKWVFAASELLEMTEHNHQRIRKVIDWYFQNIRSRFVGTYLSLTTFTEKFHTIEKAMGWQNGQDPAETIGKIKVKNVGHRTVGAEVPEDFNW